MSSNKSSTAQVKQFSPYSSFNGVSTQSTNSHEDEYETITKTGALNLIHDYVPENKLDFDAYESKLKSIATNTHHIKTPPPFISTVYGTERAKIYQEFQNDTANYPNYKQNEFKQKFLEMDIKYSLEFETAYDVVDRYKDYIYNNDLKVSSFANRPQIDMAIEKNSIYRIKKIELMRLSIDWYILIDRAVDAFQRAILYGVKTPEQTQNIYKLLKQSWSAKEKKTWGQWIKSGFESSLKTINKMAEKRNEIHLEDDEHFTSNDILYFIGSAACSELLTNYLSTLDKEEEEKSIEKMRTLIILLNQKLSIIIKSINKQIYLILAMKQQKDKEKEIKVLDEMVKTLIKLEDSLGLFDQEILSEQYALERKIMGSIIIPSNTSSQTEKPNN